MCSKSKNSDVNTSIKRINRWHKKVDRARYNKLLSQNYVILRQWPLFIYENQPTRSAAVDRPRLRLDDLNIFFFFSACLQFRAGEFFSSNFFCNCQLMATEYLVLSVRDLWKSALRDDWEFLHHCSLLFLIGMLVGITKLFFKFNFLKTVYSQILMFNRTCLEFF